MVTHTLQKIDQNQTEIGHKENTGTKYMKNSVIRMGSNRRMESVECKVCVFNRWIKMLNSSIGLFYCFPFRLKIP